MAKMEMAKSSLKNLTVKPKASKSLTCLFKFQQKMLTLGGGVIFKSLFSFACVGGSDVHGHVDVDRAVSSRYSVNGGVFLYRC